MQHGERKKISTNRSWSDFFVKLISGFISGFAILALCAVFIFIFVKALPGIQAYGFKNVFLTNHFDIFAATNPTAGIWLPSFVMLLIGALTTFFASILGVRTALFLKFRVSKKFAKKIKIVVDLLAGIPSVVFGIFCINTISPIFGSIFGVSFNGSILTASITMSLMILPTIVAFVYQAANAVDDDFLLSSIGLGNTKTHAIHKIIKKKIRPGIVIAIIFGLTRILCETSALSMILQQVSYYSEFARGFGNVFLSGLKPIGSLISSFYTSDMISEATKSILFAFGVVVFIITTIVNAVIFYFIKLIDKPYWLRINLFFKKVNRVFTYLPRKTWQGIKKITNRKNDLDEDDEIGDVHEFIMERIHTNKFRNFYTIRKLFFDYLITLIAVMFTGWILLNIAINGLGSIFSSDSTVFSNKADTTGRAFINTIIMILLAMVIALPISLLTAIFLSEFMPNGKTKRAIVFFMSSVSSTPSILFGLFGLLFFINILGWTASGHIGNSFLAGILTISLVIIPSFSLGILSGFGNADLLQAKMNSYALGIGKWSTIFHLIIPMAMDAIVNTSILTIGRIISETSSIYFTAGLNSSRDIDLMRSAQTLTTRIFGQMFQNNLSKIHNAEYSSAFLSVLLILILILFGQILLPFLILKKNKIMAWLREKFQLLKFSQFMV